jgi:hypothetical protein
MTATIGLTVRFPEDVFNALAKLPRGKKNEYLVDLARRDLRRRKLLTPGPPKMKGKTR